MQQNLARDEAGNVWEIDAQGNAVRLVTPAGGGAQDGFVQTRAADPYKQPSARLDYIQEEAAVNRIPFDNTKAAADARAAVANANKAERDARGEAPKSATEIELAAKASSEQKRANTVRSIMGRARELYSQDIKGQPASRLWGLTEKFGSIPENERFSSTSMGMLALIRPLVAQTAKEGDSDKEMEVFLSYIPNAGDSDKTIEEKFANLERLIGGMVEGQAPSATLQSMGRDEGLVGAQFRSFSPTNVAEFAAGMTGGQYQLDRDNLLTVNGQPVEISDEIANSPEFRNAYRAQFGSFPPVQASVTAGETPQAMQSRLEQQRDTPWGAIKAFDRGAADTLSLGVSAPIEALWGTAFEGGTFADNYARQRAIDNADENVNPFARFSGQVAGGIAPVMGAARLGGALIPSRPGLGIAGAESAIGGIYGGVTNPENPGIGAAIGSTAALAGNQLGQRVIGPAAQRMFAGRPAQALRRGAYAAFGREAPPVPARATPGEKMLATTTEDYGVDNIRATLQEAQGLNLPMSLADTDPRLRMLAGSAVRRSPAAREFAEQNLEPRARGQAERAIGAIERDFGRTVDIARTGDDLTGRARQAAGSLYDEAYAAPVVSTPELEALLTTPAGRQALGRARTIAANERRDPQSMGFSLDANDEVVLRPVNAGAFSAQAAARAELTDAQNAYKATRQGSGDTAAALARVEAARAALRQADDGLRSARFSTGTADTQPGYTTQTLDYVKRGMDDILEQYRDPITGRMNLDEAGRAINGVRSQLVQEVDRVNPAYSKARAAYEGPVKQRDALYAGAKAVSPRMNADNLSRMTERYDPAQLRQFQTGYRTGMAEQVEGMRFSGNPYDGVYGTPSQMEKVAHLFPGGAQNFGRQTELERQMAKTNYETIGGSPTAARAMADDQFAPAFGLQAAGEVGASMATGIPPVGAMMGAMRTGLGDRWRMGINGNAKAEQIAPILLNPDPGAALNALERLQVQRQMTTRNRRAGGMFGASLGFPLIPSSIE